jgi:hypothetical protein
MATQSSFKAMRFAINFPEKQMEKRLSQKQRNVLQRRIFVEKKRRRKKWMEKNDWFS